jgi:hypothetical protein
MSVWMIRAGKQGSAATTAKREPMEDMSPVCRHGGAMAARALEVLDREPRG